VQRYNSFFYTQIFLGQKLREKNQDGK